MSAVDLTQFHKTFFEESRGRARCDGSGAAGTGWSAPSRSDLVHTIFRAAHSIKGGAATFGFADVAAFTHVAESLLEEVRDGHRAVDPELIELMLQVVDCLRGMMERTRSASAGGRCRQ